MALVNHAKHEINAKLVFYGPVFSGKATNLNYIYRKLKPEHRGKLKTMNIGKDRMLFFDFTPAGQGKEGEYNVRFHVYSIIGEVAGSSAWKMVLKGADGVVFVADSAPERMKDNLESLENLKKIMRDYGKSIKDLPGVLQCNKHDIDPAVSLAEMENVLNYGCFTVMPAVAKKGEGVLDSLFGLMKTVLKNLRESGLELEKEPEPPAGLPAAKMAEREEEPLSVETPSCAAKGDSSTIPTVAAEAGTAAPLSAAGDTAPADGEEPVIEMAGEPEPLDNGRVRLPLQLRYGGRVKKVAVTVSFSLECDQEKE
ncbi:MAG TPA: ADP-ribosylation factor-like protein [Geobacteraceae bacterium]|nr:ADP-ribosylation factor-like protein [Geobacteraceae bacterium]